MTGPSYDELVARARALEPVLRQRARRAEELRRMPDETVADLLEAGLWAAFRPARYGGIEAPFRGMIELGARLGARLRLDLLGLQQSRQPQLAARLLAARGAGRDLGRNSPTRSSARAW